MLAVSLVKQPLKLVTLVSISMVITACGGGGGSSSSSSTSNNQTTTGTTNTVNSPTAGSTSSNVNLQSDAEKVVVDLLNTNRNTCGFGSLTLNAALTTTATNHANYQMTVSQNNNLPFASHVEQSETTTDGIKLAKTGLMNEYYSGYSLKERLNPTTLGTKATATQYDYNSYGENIALAAVTTNDTNYTLDAVKQAKSMLTGLFAAPYHIRGLVVPQFTEVGVSYKQASWQANGNYTFESLLELVGALPKTTDYADNTQLLNYPCEGITTAYQLKDETPNPFGTTRDLQTKPIGQPVYVLAPANKIISQASATITSNGVSVGYINILTANNDPNHILVANEVVFMPDSPLKPGTSYSVNYQLTYSDGETAQRSFNFTTQS